MKAQTKKEIEDGSTSLGIEFGSTRIKAILIGTDYSPVASGSYTWENQLIDGLWTYSLEDIWKGLRESYRNLSEDVFEKYGIPLLKVGSLGISAMMHGYMAFDHNEELLVPFRTWRNSTTEAAEKELTKVFNYNIPQRWSIAHLYQAILNQEAHVNNIQFLTTLAGYVHWQLTGEKVLGIGDASGMFPIDTATKNYDQTMIHQFQELLPKQIKLNLSEMLPKVLNAGANAGQLTEKGALLLDPSGKLKAGIPMCPPEGDAGTGMVATNSVAQRTGNVSAGTSAFAMIVLEKELAEVHPEIDLVTTPSGDLVVMVHTNNCSSDINAWMALFKEFTDMLGVPISSDELYQLLFAKALEADQDLGGLLTYGYYSGENITGLNEGRPLFARMPDSTFNLANFMRAHLASAFGAMHIGMEILNKEAIQVDKIVGHGGIFKTPEVGQRILASAMEAPVTVMDTAGEGGAWGIALLASYLRQNNKESLAEFLENEVFAQSAGTTIVPTKEDLESYRIFIERYKVGLAAERAAVDTLK